MERPKTLVEIKFDEFLKKQSPYEQKILEILGQEDMDSVPKKDLEEILISLKRKHREHFTEWVKANDCAIMGGLCCSLVLPGLVGCCTGLAIGDPAVVPCTFCGLFSGTFLASKFGDWYQPDLGYILKDIERVKEALVQKGDKKS